MLWCKVTCHGMASWQHPSLSPSGPRLLWRRGYQHQMPSAVVLLLCCWLDHLHAAANASVHCSAGQRCPSVAVLCTLDHIRLKLSQTHFYVHQNILYTYDLDIFSFLLTSTTYILQILAEFLQILQKLVAQL